MPPSIHLITFVLRKAKQCWTSVRTSVRFDVSSRALHALPVAILLSCSTSCSLSDLVGESRVPAGTADPALVASETGAKGLYYGVIQLLTTAMSDYTIQSGLISDELRPGQIVAQIGAVSTPIMSDSRYLPGPGNTVILDGYQGVGDQVFSALQKVRGATQQARGALQAYAPLVPSTFLGHLYAIEGYANLMLADLFCSGIPLSTVSFSGDFTLKAGSSTLEIYEQSLALFDSAIAVSADSVRILYFAKIGKARALIGLKRYADVAGTIADIPSDYQYSATYSAALPNAFQKTGYTRNGLISVSDGEGVDRVVGIRYDSLQDPRVLLTYRGGPDAIAPYRVYWPVKYDTTGASPIVIASGIEARLLRAEAELNTGGPWLATLNALRTTCVAGDVCPTPAPAGSGGTEGLPPLTDPETRTEQVALLFQERALWLFLTGHRQGDMRRQIRDYGWTVTQLYATGTYYQKNAAGVYGGYVNYPPPLTELESNPLYRGCINRDA